METIGSRIRNLRVQLELKQKDVADAIGVDRSHFSKYELGKLEVNNDMLVALAKYFDVSTDYILGIKDSYN